MKKVSSIALALIFAASAFAYEQIGQLNPYAYGVQGQAKNGKIAVQYSLNSPADSTIIAIYCDGEEVGTQVVSDNAPGLHSAVVDFSAFTTPGSYTVGIRVFGTSYDYATQLKEIKDGSTDTTALFYGFDHPKGVDIDRNPYSEYFGRIITDECLYDLNDKWWSQGKPGFYAFDAAFKPIPNGNDRGYYGEYPYSASMNIGQTAYAPYRIRISKDGRIFASTQDDKGSALYEISPDLQTWTPIFNGAFNADGLVLDADGKYITGINCGMDVRGEGENLEIIMLNTCTAGLPHSVGSNYVIATYKLGTATSWNGPATTVDTLSNVVGSSVYTVGANCGVAYDEDIDGFWYIGNRTNAIGERALVHVNAAGEVDWAISENDSAMFNLNGNGLNGGGNARVQDGLLLIGGGQRVSGTGHLLIFDINYSNNGNVPSLTKKWELNLIGISRNLNDFAIDHGHNLYIVGNSNEKIIPVVLPYSGMVETPVEAEVIRTSLDNVNGEMKATKMIENGKVIIIKNGVKYDMLGTVVE